LHTDLHVVIDNPFHCDKDFHSYSFEFLLPISLAPDTLAANCMATVMRTSRSGLVDENWSKSH
ncbi:hypothetical protein, partial [Ochrobactrum sp. 3-3]|uniref:hypothetical protein n=1 Tax=Ochrobactrum sp. 3-3 TaxID=1830124 RepID=UPI001962EFB8